MQSQSVSQSVSYCCHRCRHRLVSQSVSQSCSKLNPCISLQMPLASRCQKHNTQAYHHLVCEQHFFLRTLCLADSTAKEDKKRKKLKKLLCESAANLAELFARSALEAIAISPYPSSLLHFLSKVVQVNTYLHRLCTHSHAWWLFWNRYSP